MPLKRRIQRKIFSIISTLKKWVNRCSIVIVLPLVWLPIEKVVLVSMWKGKLDKKL